jgi:hypothetical protein
MIQIFRKLRQRLLTGSKFSKYLLYAIGEIALVVIGILIALQVNNWNEEQSRLEEEKGHLLALQKDFISAEATFTIMLGAVEEQLTHNEQLLTFLSGAPGNIPGDSITGMLRKAFIDVPFGVQVTSYSDLVNSGKFSILRSEKLRRALSEFETANTLVDNYAEKAARQWAGQVTEFFIKNLDVSAIYGRNSDVSWDNPGIPLSTGYPNTPPNLRFDSDTEALWGRELANRLAIKNVLLEDSAVSARDALRLIQYIYPLIEESLKGTD